MSPDSMADQAASAEATASAPATGTPAASPVSAVAKAVAHLLSEVKAGLADGSITGPFKDDGSCRNKDGFKRLMKEHPEDVDSFQVDGAGNLVVYKITSEHGKQALLRRSAGPSKAWFLVRTSDVFQTRFTRAEKPKGKAAKAALTPATDVTLPE